MVSRHQSKGQVVGEGGGYGVKGGEVGGERVTGVGRRRGGVGSRHQARRESRGEQVEQVTAQKYVRPPG